MGTRPTWTFLQRRHRWLTNTRKDAQHHSALEKLKSKLQWDITSNQSEWPASLCLQMGVEIREHYCTLCRDLNWYSYFGRWYGESLKNIGIKPLYDPAIHTQACNLWKSKLKKTHVPQCSLQLYLFIITSVSKCWLLSHAQLFATPWTAAHQTPLEKYRCASTYEWIKKLWYM